MIDIEYAVIVDVEATPARTYDEVAATREPRHSRLERVSADIRTGLWSRAGIPPGKSLARPETGAAFLAAPVDSGRQRPRHPASPAAKPRKVKGYSDGARKAELRRSAWWFWQSSRTSLDRRLPANREFFAFLCEKQASEEFAARAPSRLFHGVRWLGGIQGRFLLLRITGERSAGTGDLIATSAICKRRTGARRLYAGICLRIALVRCPCGDSRRLVARFPVSGR
jgi:hypothetical protein